MLGLTLGIRQVIRRRSERLLACVGIFFSLVGGGLGSYSFYLAVFYTDSHVDRLTKMGYELNVIDNPIPLSLFRSSTSPPHSGSSRKKSTWARIVTNRRRKFLSKVMHLFEAEPVSFDPGDSKFGFFTRSLRPGTEAGSYATYKWFTESERNEDGESHVRVYPMIIEGREVPNSYLICWENCPLNRGPSRIIDFCNLIVCLDGVRPVLPLAEE